MGKATGIKGYDGIVDLKFNGTHNGMAKGAKTWYANSVSPTQRSILCNGARYARMHALVVAIGANGVGNGLGCCKLILASLHQNDGNCSIVG